VRLVVKAKTWYVVPLYPFARIWDVKGCRATADDTGRQRFIARLKGEGGVKCCLGDIGVLTEGFDLENLRKG